MTTHELARLLLEGLDLPVCYINRDYEQGPEIVAINEICTIQAIGSAPCCRQEVSQEVWDQYEKYNVVQLR